MKDEKDLNKISNVLKQLLNDDILKSEDDIEKLMELYKNDPRNIITVVNEIKSFRYNNSLMNEKILKTKTINGKKTGDSIDLTKKNEKSVSLNLENIVDFEKDGKSYIKIHYPAPDDSIKVIENTTDPYRSGKELFEEISKQFPSLGKDGSVNTTSIFEQLLLRDFIEVKIKNIQEVSTRTEYSKLTDEERTFVYGSLKAIISSLNVSEETKARLTYENVDNILRDINLRVYVSVEEKLVITSPPNSPEKDRVSELKVILENGIEKYSLNSLDSNGYKYDAVQDKEEKKDDNEEFNITKSGEEEIGESLNKEGNSIKKIPPWKKRKRDDQAAYVYVLWFVIFSGIITGVIATISLFLLLNK